MQIKDFRNIVATFADPGTELLFEGSRVVMSVNGTLIEAQISTSSGDVLIDEGSGAVSANTWVLTRLAQLPLLASRLKDSIPSVPYFVAPAASLLSTLERRPDDSPIPTNDALSTMLQVLGERSPLETTVLYLTSDAGEGKTSLINQAAKLQATKFIAKESDWLLVPVPLGGRHFLRFDDITVGVLQNRYRFPFLYYQSFLALVRMGVIVPAFDGFEEMFVESSSGEALSAMGTLVGSLDSQGAMVVSTRKAYFEFENLRTQERLFDTIRTHSVGFGKLALYRWEKQQFVEYCRNRGVGDPEDIYRRVSERLGPDHALLTRAVLVSRLVDVATKSPTPDVFLDRLQQSGLDYFAVFVRGLIEREAREKWIDRSGEKELGTPLLSVDEHIDLLAQVAIAMWESRVDYLKRDGLEFVADYFSEITRKSAFQAQQIRARIRGHAMLVPSANASDAVEFDHDEFRLFFLGEGIARLLRPMNDRARADVLSAFRRGVLPRHAQHSMIRAMRRDQACNPIDVVKFLLSVASLDAQASYTQENCSDIIIRMLSEVPSAELTVRDLSFSDNALRNRKLDGITFQNCYFAPTSLELTQLRRCTFIGSKFAQLRVHDSTQFENVVFDESSVDSMLLVARHREVWDPSEIRAQLKQLGVQLETQESLLFGDEALPETDADIRDLEKLIRYFRRSTHMSEGVMLMRLGNRGRYFIDTVVPDLIHHSVLVEVEHIGSGTQRRFRLGLPLEKVNAALERCHGSYAAFISSL